MRVRPAAVLLAERCISEEVALGLAETRRVLKSLRTGAGTTGCQSGCESKRSSPGSGTGANSPGGGSRQTPSSQVKTICVPSGANAGRATASMPKKYSTGAVPSALMTLSDQKK